MKMLQERLAVESPVLALPTCIQFPCVLYIYNRKGNSDCNSLSNCCEELMHTEPTRAFNKSKAQRVHRSLHKILVVTAWMIFSVYIR